MIYEYYKPVMHIKIRFEGAPKGKFDAGTMYYASGTQNVFEGLSKTQTRLMRFRGKTWKWTVEKRCTRNPCKLWVWLHRKINNWQIV